MLFFVMLHHVTDAGWSWWCAGVAEQVLTALPLLVLLFVPILVGRCRGSCSLGCMPTLKTNSWPASRRS